MAENILPLMMFVTLLGLMLTGYPIGVILGGVAILFGFIGMAFDLFRMVEFFNLVPRVWVFRKCVAVSMKFTGLLISCMIPAERLPRAESRSV